MPLDPYASFASAPNDPARDAFPILANDTAALAVLPRALYVGTGGMLAVRLIDAASDVTFRNVGAGQILDIRVSYVRATGTTAADLIGLV